MTDDHLTARVRFLGDRQVRFNAGFSLPATMMLTMSQDGYDLVARVEHDGERFVCSELRMIQREGGSPITGDAIRAVQVGDLVYTALRLAQSKRNKATLQPTRRRTIPGSPRGK
jgi:hypothetical protein